MSWRPSSAGPVPGAAGSQTSTRPPSPPVTTRPSASTATACTAPSWRPSSAGPAPGAAGSQTSTRPSDPPVTTRPSASTATAAHRRRGGQLGRAGPGRGRVPDQHPPVGPAGDHPPVGQHRHRLHRPSWRPSSAGPAPGAAGSQTSTRPSAPPVTTRPSASTATACTAPSWRPSSAGPAPGAAGSHTSTRRSSPPVTTRPSGSTATAHTGPSWRPSSPDRARLARRVVHRGTRPGPGRDCRRLRILLSEVVFSELGCLHPQLPQDVAWLVHRLRGPQVVGLAGDGRQRRPRPPWLPGSRRRPAAGRPGQRPRLRTRSLPRPSRCHWPAEPAAAGPGPRWQG